MIEEYYHPMKMKRKNLEQLNDDFSYFSLSSPATKIRRLDAELPPLIEEEEIGIPIVEESVLDQSSRNNAGAVGGGKGGVIEELPSEPEIGEKAIVLFKPSNLPIVPSPSNFSVTVDPQLILGFKSQVLSSNQSNPFRRADDEAIEDDMRAGARNDCMAVVPWVPSQLPLAAGAELPSQTDLSDMMDAEEMETASMDVEDNNVGLQRQAPESGFNQTNLNEGIHQWQQQHCMIPKPPHNTSTPILWYQ